MLKTNRDLKRLPPNTRQLLDKYESQIHRLAPVVRFYPDEKYFVMDPMEFLQKSRFRHHKDGTDEGHNSKLKEWKETNSKHDDYYNIPVEYINSYGLHSNGKNRRPRDENSGKDWDLFLQPKGKPKGDSAPTGKIPTFYYVKTEQGVPLISYWWFMGYNDGQVAGFANHQGDWEHVTVSVKDNDVDGVWFARHEKATYISRDQLQMTNQRPIIFCANGTHASYHRKGEFHKLNVDKTDDGYRWQTWKNLQPLANQPWRDFAGAWGKVGEFAHSTGPLGPWHKRKRK